MAGGSTLSLPGGLRSPRPYAYPYPYQDATPLGHPCSSSHQYTGAHTYFATAYSYTGSTYAYTDADSAYINTGSSYALRNGDWRMARATLRACTYGPWGFTIGVVN